MTSKITKKTILEKLINFKEVSDILDIKIIMRKNNNK